MSDGLSGLRKRPVFVERYSVHLKPLSIGQVRAFQAWRKDHESDPFAAVLMLVSMSVCDADGALLLATPEAAGDLDMQLVNGLCEEIVALNGLGDTPDPKADSPATPVAPSSVG